MSNKKYIGWMEDRIVGETQHRVYEDTPRDPKNAIMSLRDNIDWDAVEKENRKWERKAFRKRCRKVYPTDIIKTSAGVLRFTRCNTVTGKYRASVSLKRDGERAVIIERKVFEDEWKMQDCYNNFLKTYGGVSD